MWSTFTQVANSVVSEIDDFALVIFLLIVGNKISQALYSFIHKFLKLPLLYAQAVKMSLQVFLFSICAIQLLGAETLRSASAGIAIGVGYAFQPYIISIFNGLMIHNDNVMAKGKIISIPGLNILNARVDSIGLFNTALYHEGDMLVLSNSMLSKSCIVLHRDKS